MTSVILFLAMLFAMPRVGAAQDCTGDAALGVTEDGIVTVGPAAGRYRFAKYDQTATDGSCVLPVGPDDLARRERLLASSGDNFAIAGSPAENETHALAEFLLALDHVGDGTFPEIHDRSWKVSYLSHRTVAGRRSHASTCVGTHLQLVTACQNGRNLPADRRLGGNRNNTAHIAHEWAHCLGWLPFGDSSYYESYFEAVPERCLPTHWSEFHRMPNPRNEEFAEVFALYLLDPDVLQEYGCESALVFFGGLFGEDDPSTIRCEIRRSRFAAAAPKP